MKKRDPSARPRISPAGMLPAALAFLLSAPDPGGRLFAQEVLIDLAGRTVGSRVRGTDSVHSAPEAGGPRFLPGGELVAGGRVRRYPAGYYLARDAAPSPGDNFASSQFLFRDGTLEYLPLMEWDPGDIETGDVNGDGLVDIVFSISRSDCDSIPGTKPRIWIQDSSHRFVDETAARIPALSTSTFDIDLFDADGDADTDILLCGHSCLSQFSAATLLINDGTGRFTDESSSRILAVPEKHVLYFAEPALIDSDASPDIVAILVDLNQPQAPNYYPYLFLNTGDGHFWPDHRGRLLDYGYYGFFNVEAADLTGDGLEDLLFMNMASPGDGLNGRLALFRNTGDGFMRDETPVRMGGDSLRWTRAAAISDVDGDGDPDVLDVGFFVGGNNPQVKLLKNDGSGFFTEEHAGDIAGLSGWFNDAEFAPLSRDTLPDLYIARIIVGQDASDLLLLNRGDGSFRDSSGLLPPVLDFTVSASVSDFDRDGDIDIVVGNGNATQDLTGQNRLYINQRFSPPADVRDGDGIPRGTILRQNYPNPFNASTVIRYSLGTGASVSLTAVNVLGTVVMKSEPGYQPPGTYEFRWDAGGLPGGIYFYTLRVGGMRVSPRAAVLLK